ncbi:MAG: PP2C family protein-serine/threonine phosphatase, partial [Gemmatimonadales bacterium]
AAWLEPLPEADDLWLEIGDGERGAAHAPLLAQVVAAVLVSEREVGQITQELSERYEEIDLIYTISEILGHTIRLDEAAQRILQEVAPVVRARRATLLVLDEERRVLRIVAARGMDPTEVPPIELDDPTSVAARVFREMKPLSYDPGASGPRPGRPERRGYRGHAFLSVPVMYAPPGGAPQAIGVINLTDRLGEDAFSAGDRKLVAAIANQIGAAIANARLVQRDLTQQRVRHELELAHDLQLRLLPSPLVVAARADVAARCRPAESVGGDFYNLLQLPDGRIGVMIGDVSSHGFGAALIMALAMAASGIHAESALDPTVVLRRLEESLAEELARTEMFLTTFYAVLDPTAGRLVYANAGHPHAFLVSGTSGEATRLAATRAPLGLDTQPGTDVVLAAPRRANVLCLFTDGMADARSEDGERFGEERLLGHVRGLRDQPTRDILEAIYADLAAFTGGGPASDDRTLVLVKA